MSINWVVNKTDLDLILQIVDRIDPDEKQKSGLIMGMITCHLNCAPLDLERMLEGDPTDIAHDVYSIHEYLALSLTECFSPRFTKQ